jgi:hypothetical protein
VEVLTDVLDLLRGRIGACEHDGSITRYELQDQEDDQRDGD